MCPVGWEFDLVDIGLGLLKLYSRGRGDLKKLPQNLRDTRKYEEITTLFVCNFVALKKALESSMLCFARGKFNRCCMLMI